MIIIFILYSLYFNYFNYALHSNDVTESLHERDYTLRSSLCYRSVVCNLHAPCSQCWNFRQYFFAILYLSHLLTCVQSLRRSFPGNSSVGSVKPITYVTFGYLCAVCGSWASCFVIARTSLTSKRVEWHLHIATRRHNVELSWVASLCTRLKTSGLELVQCS